MAYISLTVGRILIKLGDNVELCSIVISSNCSKHGHVIIMLLICQTIVTTNLIQKPRMPCPVDRKSFTHSRIYIIMARISWGISAE